MTYKRTNPSRVGPKAAVVLAIMGLLSGLLTWSGQTLPAPAYTPATIPASSTSSVSVKVTHGAGAPSGLATPKQGDSFNYTFDFTFAGMSSPDVTRTTTIKVNADGNAPFAATNGTWQFSTDGGNTFGPLPTGVTVAPTSCTSGSTCTFTITGLANGVLRYTRQATVNAGLADGTLIMATANAEVRPEGRATMANLGATALNGVCAGPYTFTQEVQDGGAWLVDMKFGDKLGNGLVTLTPGDREIVAWTEGTTATDWVRFTGPNGEDLTGQVMANATYIANDPSAPLYVGGGASNATWFDSLNWPYDPSTFTGSTRLPVGTKVQVQRQVTYLDCYGGVYSSTPNTGRQFGIATQIAINDTPARGSGYDVFAMPGFQPPATCVNNLYISSNAGVNSTGTTFYKWTPNVETVNEGVVSSYRSDAIAATNNYPAYIFSVQFDGPVVKIQDTGTNAPLVGAGTATLPSGLTMSAEAAAFDPDGNLWSGTGGGNLWYLTKAQVDSLVAGGSVVWNRGARLVSPTNVGFGIHDMAFTGDGTLYVLGSYTTSNRRLATAPTSGLTTASTTVEVALRANYGTIGTTRGLAFVGDTLYLGVGTSNSATRVSIIDWRVSTAPLSVTNQYAQPSAKLTAPMPSDFASCSFPTATPPTNAPAFKVQKSAINADGSVATPGGTGTPTTMGPDGTITVKYLVTIQNTGNQAGAAPDITDTVTVPGGFTLNSVSWVAQGSTTPTTSTTNLTSHTFTIPSAGILDPSGTTTNPISASYLVTVKLKPTATTTPGNWTSIGECNTTGGGTPGTGVFNKVTITGDDGSDGNNDACVPVEGAQLSLVKKIVDQAGNEIVPSSTDAQYFTLVASGDRVLSGSSSTSGATAVTGSVIPGAYSLGEQGNDYDQATGLYTTSGTYEQYGAWECKTSTGETKPLTGNTVTVNKNEHVTCTVKNTRTPKVHVIKTAGPADADPHVAPVITPAADGTFDAVYTVRVVNGSAFATTAGPVTDRFVVPEGLVWDGTKTATVTYNGPAGTATGVPATLTQAQLVNSTTVASAIQLTANQSVTFTISIPLKLNLTGSGTTTVYEQQAATLSVCEAKTSSTGTYTTTASGIPNVTTLAHEDLDYSVIAIEDNVACIPVQASTGWAVKKAAAASVEPDGTVTWAEAGTTGGNVQVVDGQVTVRYRVTITNTGDLTMNHPLITDNLTLPVGFDLVSWTVAQGTTQLGTGGTPSFTIPASTTPVPATNPDSFVEYLVTVVAEVSETTPVDWTKAQTCDTSGWGNASAGGFFNLVRLNGDSDGPDNNDACVPVESPAKPITVEKYGTHCDAGQPSCSLTGAAFSITTDPAGAANLAPLTTTDAGATFTSQQLQFGTYYLVETKAPDGFNLLATPIAFTLSADGVQLDPNQANGALIEVSGTGLLTIKVTDTKTGDLPQSGGRGHRPNMALGLLLLAGAGLAYRFTSGSGLNPARARATNGRR